MFHFIIVTYLQVQLSLSITRGFYPFGYPRFRDYIRIYAFLNEARLKDPQIYVQKFIERYVDIILHKNVFPIFIA
jgi:hypothetical protein